MHRMPENPAAKRVEYTGDLELLINCNTPEKFEKAKSRWKQLRSTGAGPLPPGVHGANSSSPAKDGFDQLFSRVCFYNLIEKVLDVFRVIPVFRGICNIIRLDEDLIVNPVDP